MTDQPLNEEPDDPDWTGIPPEQKEKTVSLMQKMIELGVCAVYGQEEDRIPDATAKRTGNGADRSAALCSPLLPGKKYKGAE